MLPTKIKNRIRIITPFLIAAVIIPPSAHAESDGEKLAKSCEELLAIYKKKDEKALFSDWTTSPAEAMKAGYCRGVIDEYRRGNYHCVNTTWRDQAEAIVFIQSIEKIRNPGVGYLLKTSCAF